MKRIIYLALIVISLIILIFMVYRVTLKTQSGQDKISQTNIESFEDCVAAGNPVLESYPRQCRTRDGKSFTEAIEDEVQPPTPTFFEENWKTYTNQDLGLSFPYPSDFTLTENPASIDSYYISIMSPIDQNKLSKITTVGENELKIEIVTEPSVENDSSEKCYYDHSENPKILSQKQVSISGVPATTFQWEGMGTGEFTCVIQNGKRYMINKYPATTSHEDIYDNFIGNLLLY